MEVKEVFDEVVKDKPFYKNSGGGVTVTGGEALSQSEFVTELLEMSKKEGLHTALDTTGYASWEKMKKVLNFADLVLFDIKHLDSREHKRTTRVENELILENLEKMSRLKNIWLRMPLIRGFNDSEAYIRNIVLLGKRTGAEKVSLLPYHEVENPSANSWADLLICSPGQRHLMMNISIPLGKLLRPWV